MSDFNKQEPETTNTEKSPDPATEPSISEQGSEVSDEPIQSENTDTISEEKTGESLLEEQPQTPSAPSPAVSKQSGGWLKEAVDYAEIFVFAICFVILLFSFVFRLCTVDGASMENTLYENESLIVSDLFYTPKQGDIIVFHQTGTLNEPVVKRVIATEGETVQLSYTMDTMTVTVTDVEGNIRILEEPYMKYEGSPLYYFPTTVVVPEGQLFVMGDNRNDSKDSRHADIGFVDTRRVLGKVIFRITPFNRFGTVD